MKTVKELREAKFRIMTKKLNAVHVKDIHKSFDNLIMNSERAAWWLRADSSFVKSLDNDIPGAKKELDNVYKQMLNQVKIIKKYEKHWTKIGIKGVQYKIQESLNEATAHQVIIAWDMGDPNQYAGDWQDQGIYLDDWNKKRGDITVAGTDKDLLNWLVDDYGMDKKEAQQLIKKGKKVKL